MSGFGIMFHHFHDNKKHPSSQGSIDGAEFRRMLSDLKGYYKLLNASNWYEQANSGNLGEREICLTFDDALKCQYDVACNILDDMGITAFWFVYSSPLVGVLEKLEVYRAFRTQFGNIEDFYEAFESVLARLENDLCLDMSLQMQTYAADRYLRQHRFYSDNDRRFRYIRDVILGQKRYEIVMEKMIEDYAWGGGGIAELWLGAEDISKLDAAGHIVGLHSHTHPTSLAGFSYERQFHEYNTNKRILEDILGHAVMCASYPCNLYNGDTERIFNEIGIKIAFNATMDRVETDYPTLHCPRLDHAYLMEGARL
jgi:peptidoglycan/xylan/chitin deacetylase (PgdA/CDA1 family)